MKWYNFWTRPIKLISDFRREMKNATEPIMPFFSEKDMEKFGINKLQDKIDLFEKSKKIYAKELNDIPIQIGSKEPRKKEGENRLDMRVSIDTLKLILKGIRAEVVEGSTINQAINAMVTKYKKRHPNVSRKQFIEDINNFLDNTFVETKTNEDLLQYPSDKFVEIREVVRKAKLASKTESKVIKKDAENAIREMLKGKVKDLTPEQMKLIMQRLAELNPVRPIHSDNFIEYVDSLILTSDYNEIDTTDNFFEVKSVFMDLNEKFSARQVIFMSASAEDRKSIYAQDLISLSKEIEDALPNVLEIYNCLKQIEKETIRKSICTAFRIKIDQNTIIQLSYNNKTTHKNSNANQRNSFKTKWSVEQSGRESLLFPFIYLDFPTLIEIQENIEDYKSTLITFVENSEFISIEKIKELLIAVEHGAQSIDDEIHLFWTIYELKNRSGEILFSHEINKLKGYIKNPIKEFFMLTDRNVENISFASENPKFHKILKEIGRDNVITENERSYIFEKAEEHFIDKSKLTLYLDNPFIGFESFKIFINQICEDGIVTEVERDYIDEKAKQYNVPAEKIDEMISVGLIRAAGIERLSNKEEFYDVILIYLFAYSFNIKSVGNIFFKALHSKNINKDEDIHIVKEILTDELSKRLSIMSIHFETSANIRHLFDSLNISCPNYEEAINFQNKNKSELFSKKALNNQSDENFTFDGETYQIKCIEVNGKPLFSIDYINSENLITINLAHWIFSDKNDVEVSILKKIILSLVATKSEFTNSIIDSFFMKLNGKIDLLKYDF
jgi:hypothetical protein